MTWRTVAVVFCASAGTALVSCARPPDQEPMRALVEALGPRRLVEPRLTGGFAYAPCRELPAGGQATFPSHPRIGTAKCSSLPPPGSAAREAFSRAAVVVYRRRKHGPYGQGLAKAGVVSLIANTAQGAERAISNLEAAAEESPDPGVLSDLSAAYLVRAGQRQEPADLIRALETVERALAAAPRLPEALFNRALILDRLWLRNQAQRAWRQYQTVDSKSSWSAEAARHLAVLAILPTTDFGQPERDAVQAAARRAASADVLRLVALSPQSAREYVMNELLVQWGESFLRGKRAAAASPLATARAIGAALLILSADRMVADTVAAIDRASSPGFDPSISLALARAHVTLSAGNRLATGLSIERALPLLRETQAGLSRAGSPMVYWAIAALGGVELVADRHDSAVQLFSELTQRSDPRIYPALHGRAHWGLGLVRDRQGRLGESLAEFQAAAALFARARETRNQATVEALIAEIREFLGQGDAALTHRYQALATLSVFRGSPQLHIVLWVAAEALLRDGQARSALCFQDEDISVAEQSRQPYMLAMAYMQRSHIHAALENDDLALSDLENARSVNAKMDSTTSRSRLGASIDLAEGQAFLRRDPQKTLPLVTRALGSFRAQRRSLEELQALALRAKALAASGNQVAAEAQLLDAIDLFSRQRAALADPKLRLAYSETAQDLFDEMMLLEAVERHEPARSFGYSELARSVPASSGPAPGALQTTVPEAPGPAQVTSRLPGGVALVEFSLAEHHLLTWFVFDGRIELVDRVVEVRHLESMVNAFVTAAQQGSEPHLKHASMALYRTLIPPQVGSLPPGSRLVFVPDRILNSIPFAALQNPASGRYLVEEHGVSLAPSAQAYLAIADRNRGRADGRSRWSSLLIGNPTFDRRLFPQLSDLPGAMTEIAAVGAFYTQPTVLVGADATRSRVLEQLDRHEVFAFAGHAVNNPRSPGDSYLVLASSPQAAEPGVLFAREVGERRFQHLRLAILSACRTAGTSSSRTSGLTGLTRPFLEAGASAVLGTLWQVDDQAARRFLPEFHRRLMGGETAAAALRDVQLMMLHAKEPSQRSPASWAAFQLVGDIQ